MKTSALGLTFLATTAWGLSAAAQAVPDRTTEGVTLPFQSIASTDDAAAIAVNPANLAFASGPELRFTWIHTGEESPLANRGYSLDGAFPFWILGTGLRIDWLVPPQSAPAPFADVRGAHRFNWVRWATGLRLGEAAAFGTTLAWSHSSDPRLDGYFSATSGLTLRPSRYLSTAVVARDWNIPQNTIGTQIRPTIDVGASLRPIGGRRLLEIGAEASYHEGVDEWVPGANVNVAVPYVGRFRAGARMLDVSRAHVVMTAGVEVNFDTLQMSGGAVFGNHLSPDGTGFYAGAAMRGFVEAPKVPSLARVVRIRIESTPGIRQHTHNLRRLWQIAEDPEIDGVLFEMRAKPTPSLAHAEEFVDAINVLRQRGKKVMCHLEDGGGRELFACSAADRIAMNPAGGLRFSGLSTRYMYFGGLMEKLGVRADFVRIGAHKLAPEQFTTGSSKVARADHRELLGEFDNVYMGQLARGRHMSIEQARSTIAGGPFIAPEARDAKLVDALVYEDELKRFVEEVYGHSVTLVDDQVPTRAKAEWRSPPKVAVVYLHGNMVDGNSRNIPFIGVTLAGSYTVAAALKQAREDPSVRAVVFRIETGGGSSLAADVILREATLTARVKPLIVSMGSTAASGGYYAAVAAREIFANPATVTGSIGIFYGKVDVVGLMDKLGVGSEATRSAPRADAESFFRPFTDDERSALGDKVKQFYDLFIGRVAEGRKMQPDEVHAVAQGKVWTGSQAHRVGLVDTVGGFRQALARARELADLPHDAPIVELPAHNPTLFERVLQLAGVPSIQTTDGQTWLPAQVLSVARALAPFMVFEPHKPLALSEVVVSEP